MASHHYVRRHLPTITPRIEFELPQRLPLPETTARVEWTCERLRRPPANASADPRPARERAQLEEDPAAQGPPPPAQGPPPPPRVSESPEPENENMIMKPKGEPGRRNSGGYNLQNILVDDYNWLDEDVGTLTYMVNREATRRLDLSKSYRSQRREVINEICDKATRLWPVLANYNGCWPVHSIIKLKLKYRSEAHRRNEGRRQSARLRNALAAGGGDDA